MLSEGGRRILALEADRESPGLRQALQWAAIDDIKLCRIPVDKRHNSKVDYPALSKMMKSAGW